MSNNPKILVTICNYNHSKYLKESIESIQDQTYENLDICVVDDGSDDIEKVLDLMSAKQKEDSRIRFINLEKNYGKWHALNTAIASTDASWCTSHDADDISLRQRLEMQVTVLRGTKTYHNLCGFEHCWTEEDVAKHRYNEFDLTNISYSAPESVTPEVVQGWQTPGINHYYTGPDFESAGVSALFKKEIWNTGIRFNPPGQGLRLLLSEDSDFNLRTTLLFQSTSLLWDRPYLYRRNTSTNKEEF